MWLTIFYDASFSYRVRYIYKYLPKFTNVKYFVLFFNSNGYIIMLKYYHPELETKSNPFKDSHEFIK